MSVWSGKSSNVFNLRTVTRSTKLIINNNICLAGQARIVHVIRARWEINKWNTFGWGMNETNRIRDRLSTFPWSGVVIAAGITKANPNRYHQSREYFYKNTRNDFSLLSQHERAVEKTGRLDDSRWSQVDRAFNTHATTGSRRVGYVFVVT